jgi:hypothetical protein
VGDQAVVSSPRNAYFVELGPDLIACRTPADRQDLSRWLRYQKNNQIDNLPPYLLAAANPDDPAILVMAISLADSLDPNAIRRGLMQSQVMSSRRNPDYKAIAQTIGLINGIKLTVRAGSPLRGELTVNFSTDIRAVQYFAHELLNESLQKVQLFLPEFNGWEMRQTEQSVSIGGPLSVNGLRKLGALIRTPAPAPEAADMASYQAANPAQRSLAASQRYYQSIKRILDDVKNDKTHSYKGLAEWYGQYASQMDQLPILDVAPELISYEATTAELLRALAVSLRGISSNMSYTQRNSFYGAYGLGVVGYGTQLTTQQVMDTLVARGENERVQLWAKIENATSDIRRQMTQKFQVEF